MKLKVGLIGLGDQWESRHRPALLALADRFDVKAQREVTEDLKLAFRKKIGLVIACADVVFFVPSVLYFFRFVLFYVLLFLVHDLFICPYGCFL